MEQKRKQLVSSIELLELDLQSTQIKWQRFQTLRKSGAMSGEDMLTAELNVKRTEIQLRQQRELIEDGKRATRSSIDGARLQQAILRKQPEQQQQLLAQASVRAPFAGMLTSLTSEEGASVTTGQLVAKVSELNNYRVEATLSDFHARSLETALSDGPVYFISRPFGPIAQPVVGDAKATVLTGVRSSAVQLLPASSE